jgi:hypothetical protein
MRVNKELLDFIVEPLGISSQLLIAKIENDDMLSVFVDNIQLFQRDEIYRKLLQWIFIYFEPVFRMDPSKWDKIKDKDTYLLTLIYLIIPTVHMRFFHKNQDTATPYEILNEFFNEIGTQVDLSSVSKKEIEFTW